LWAHAARIYRDELANPAQALEAALRLLATDLKSRDALTQVEESAVQAGQWARLLPVYDRLIKAAANDMERVELLVRHADLLERRANSPSDALDRVLQASALAPTDEALIARAEQLAARGDRGAELVAMCDQQAAQTSDPRAQVEWLVRAARFSISTAADKPAAQAYLEAALAASGASVALWEYCISAAQQLDPDAGASEPHVMLKALIAAHRKVAQRSAPAVGATLMLRASRLLEERLDDERAAFDMLRNGSAMFPLDENLYDTLLERAEANGRLDALDAHLSRGVDDALDAVTAAGLLARRARLLEGPLGRPEDAANVYAKLLQLSPDDLQAAAKLRDSLRRAKRFQDLLVVIHKQMQHAKRGDEKLELLKESAHIWELDLKNRWEAVDAWRKVLEHSPRDAEAIRALTRLDRRSLPPIPPPSAADEPEPEPAHDPEQSNGAEHELPATPSVEEPAPIAAAAPQPTAARVEEVKSVDVVPIDETQPVATEELQIQAVPAQPTTSRMRRATQPPPPPPDALRHSTRPPQSGGPPPAPSKSNPSTKA
jgi:tetratricopeptide (TPR) repeat protein